MFRIPIFKPDKLKRGISSFSELAAAYEQSLDWLASLVKMGGHGRLNKYVATMRRLENLKSSEDARELLANSADLAAFYEISEIVNVCHSLTLITQAHSLPENKLHKLKKGVESYVDNGARNDPSRDTFYEFSIGARLIRAGLPVEFPDDNDKRCDVVTEFNEHRVFIECKRVKSRKMLVPDLKEGLRQLSASYRIGRTKEIGLIYASIDMIANPKLQIFEAVDLIGAEKISSGLSVKFANAAYDEIMQRNKRPHKKSLAFFLTSRIPFFFADSKMSGMRTYSYFRSFFESPFDQYYALFDEFFETVSNGKPRY